MSESLGPNIENREPLSPKEQQKRLREIVRTDARNRADFIREIREMLNIEATLNPDYKNVTILPDRMRNDEIRVITPGGQIFVIVLPSTKDSLLGTTSIPYSGRIATIENRNNGARYGLHMIETLGNIEEILRVFIQIESIKRRVEEKGGSVSYQKSLKALVDQNGVILVNFDLLEISTQNIDTLMRAWDYLLDPKKERNLHWKEKV